MPNSRKVRDCSLVLDKPLMLNSDKIWVFGQCLTHPRYRATARMGLLISLYICVSFPAD